MKASYYDILLLACLVYVMPLRTHALKILGGFSDVYNLPSTVKRGTRYQWGTHQTGLEGTKVLTVAKSYCWDTFTDSRGYCYQKLLVSTRNDPSEEYYEILGSKQVVMDSQSLYIDRIRHSYGLQSAGQSESEFLVHSGESWSPGNNEWGYAYLYFIVKRSNRPSLTDALSWQARNAGSEEFSQTEQYTGRKASSSTRVTIAQFRCWTRAWGEGSNCYEYIWRAYTTLVSHSLHYANNEILGVTSTPKGRPLIIENHVSGLGTIYLPRIEGSEQVTTTSTAKFNSTFDFVIDSSTEIEFKAFGSSASVGYSSHFVLSSTSEMSNTLKDPMTISVELPSRCDPGFRLTYNVTEHSERQSIPVDFVLDRAGSQWTESKDVEVTLTWLEINANDCCLYAYANPSCGTERFPLC